MARGRGRHENGRGRGRGRHEFGRGRGTHVSNGTDVNLEDQNTTATSQSTLNPELSEAPEVAVNLSTLYPNGKT